MRELSVSLEDILEDPSAVFDSPQEVVDDQHLNDDEKREILQSWKEDAKALLRAESENMPSAKSTPAAPELLREISNILIDFEKKSRGEDDSRADG
ncbi:hypothetical protein [Sneathiella sp.]|uniref:hypothetical protein n=1 Tax=Sneathiella sp. TaxID=1964365 RepID=UPI002629C8D5|nr:hypothetical protein [Sneathiella sp.]MDF2368224.1 hypothetical protein [Sneathiella sp.]